MVPGRLSRTRLSIRRSASRTTNRRLAAPLATLSALATVLVLVAGAPAAQADETGADAGEVADGATTGGSVRTVIPLPRVTVSRVCGARDDILTVDPAWLARWGDKVVIFPNSLTFQGGDDDDLAKPSGMIRPEFRTAYRWAGSRGTGWASWLLYPGTVKPVVDQNVPCPITVEAPRLTRTAVCGERNDQVTFADEESRSQWRITARTWNGATLTVSLRVRRGYVGPGGATEVEQDFIDTGACPTV